MHVWNVLHAARWKYRTQKIAILAPSHNFVGLHLRSWGMYRQPKFAALNRGRHQCSAVRPSRWTLAHFLVMYTVYLHNSLALNHDNWLVNCVHIDELIYLLFPLTGFYKKLLTVTTYHAKYHLDSSSRFDTINMGRKFGGSAPFLGRGIGVPI